MAATPPPRSPVCPATPLWPAKYEHPREVRRSSRIAAGKPSQGEPTTPPPTIKKDRITRNLFGASGSASSSMNDSFAGLSTAIQTPKKKKTETPETPASIHRSAKAVSRIQKFDLSQRNESPITIFEDSKDRIPGPINENEDDIFKPSERQKRRKTSAAARLNEPDPSEDGMIVVQRGRRIHKKFDDAGAFTDPMPRKKLFAEYLPATVLTVPDSEGPPPVVDTDDEETEREDSPEPTTRIVRFTEVTTTSVSSTVASDVMKTPGKAVAKSQTKTQFRTPKSHIEISNTSFLTPPATIQRDDTTSSFEDDAAGRSSVKRKLSYNGPATPEATPAKKRTKLSGGGGGLGTPRDDEVFGTSPSRTRRVPKTRI